MPKKAEINLKDLILSLFKDNPEVNISMLAKASGLSLENSANRRALQRAFKNLSDLKLIKSFGNARARTYVLNKESLGSYSSEFSASSDTAFKGIKLSSNSIKLKSYVSQSLKARVPVGYNQDFLRSYLPNQSYYLSTEDRKELLRIGTVENKILPAGTYARNILDRLLIDLSWNSSRLEGNTYSLLETKRLIELGETAKGKDATEAQMILNHKGAIEYLIESAEEEEINSHQICSIHALLSENLLGDSSASGRVRQIAVGISGSTYLPLENPHILNESFQIFIDKFNLIMDPFEQSFFSLVHLSYLQAFEDVNKRTARLVANMPLIKNNLRPLSFTEIDRDAYISSLLGIYEKNNVTLLKDVYLWAYNRSAQQYSAIQQSMGEPNLLKLTYRDLIREIIRSIILKKIHGHLVVNDIREGIISHNVREEDFMDLFNVIETEVMNLHEGNIARYKVKPSEYRAWKELQGERGEMK